MIERERKEGRMIRKKMIIEVKRERGSGRKKCPKRILTRKKNPTKLTKTNTRINVQSSELY